MLSGVDFDFIYELEGGIHLKAYVPCHADGRVVNKSGVTMGAGVDLGQVSESEFTGRLYRYANKKYPSMSESDVADFVEGMVSQWSCFYGVKGGDAVATLADEAMRQGGSVRILRSVADFITEATFDSTLNHPCLASLSGLSPALSTIVASVAWQYGANLNKATPMFYAAVQANNVPSVLAILRDFKDSFPTRRNREADYLSLRSGVSG